MVTRNGQVIDWGSWSKFGQEADEINPVGQHEKPALCTEEPEHGAHIEARSGVQNNPDGLFELVPSGIKSKQSRPVENLFILG